MTPSHSLPPIAFPSYSLIHTVQSPSIIHICPCLSHSPPSPSLMPSPHSHSHNYPHFPSHHFLSSPPSLSLLYRQSPSFITPTPTSSTHTFPCVNFTHLTYSHANTVIIFTCTFTPAFYLIFLKSMCLLSLFYLHHQIRSIVWTNFGR